MECRIKMLYISAKGMIIILENILKEKLEDQCENNIDSYIKEVAEWFSYIILKYKKYEIDHSFDPPWDNSGRVICSGEQINLDDYDTFEDFLENEYSGTSSPSYMSGHGMFHEAYREDFDYMTIDWMYSQVSPVIKGLIKDENKDLKKFAKNYNIEFTIKEIDNIIENIIDEDIVGDISWELEWHIKDYVLDTHPLILFNRGKEEAIKEIKLEKLRRIEEQERSQAKRKEAEYLWDKILKMFKLKYGHQISDRIDKPLYDQKLKQVLIEIHLNGISIEEIQNIGESLSFKFSNSVSRLISEFEIGDRSCE